MSRRIIQTELAPAAVGPYSQGVVAGGFLFTAMQIALEPTSGQLAGATAQEQARQCLENIRAIVTAAGGALADVVKITVYLTDISAFGAVNEIYAGFFPAGPPARGAVQVVALPRGALVAVEAIAQVG